MPRRRTGVLVRLVVTVVLLAVILRSLDVRGVASSIRSFDPAWVALALTLQFAGVAASTLAWRALLAPFERPDPRPFRELFRFYLVSRFVTLVGPGTVVGDAARVYQTRRDTLTTPAAAVFAEKALYAGSLLAVATLAGLAVSTPSAAVDVIRLGGGVVVGGLVAVALGARFARTRLTHPLAAAVNRVVTGYRSYPFAVFVAALATLGTVAATVLSTWALVVALDLSVSHLYLWATVPLVAIAVALPLSVQGLGVREGAYVLLFGFVGVAPEAALAISVANFGLSLVVAAVGAALYLSGRQEVTPA